MQLLTQTSSFSLMGLYADLNRYASELNKNPDEMLAEAIENYLDKIDLEIAESRLGETPISSDEMQRFIDGL